MLPLIVKGSAILKANWDWWSKHKQTLDPCFSPQRIVVDGSICVFDLMNSSCPPAVRISGVLDLSSPLLYSCFVELLAYLERVPTDQANVIFSAESSQAKEERKLASNSLVHRDTLNESPPIGIVDVVLVW